MPWEQIVPLIPAGCTPRFWQHIDIGELVSRVGFCRSIRAVQHQRSVRLGGGVNVVPKALVVSQIEIEFALIERTLN